MAVIREGEVEDGALVRQAQAGNTEAFGCLVERHMRHAYAAAFALVGSREDALDVSQEAFARAFRARRVIDPSRPFFPWLYQILRRLCFNLRRDRRTRVRSLEGAANWLAEEAGDRAVSLDPARALARAEARRRVAAAIARLPPLDREALVLKEFEGLTYREIAELVGIPMGTVMSRLYAARRRLAEALEDER